MREGETDRDFASWLVLGLRCVAMALAAFVAAQLTFDAYLEAERRWVVGVWGLMFMPSILGVICAWQPAKHPRMFVVFALAAVGITSAVFGWRYPETETDFSVEMARREGYRSGLFSGFIGFAVIGGAVWLTAKLRR